ncbi:hypothetical protein ZYGR_0I01730 [Zygosaccharomyces rouxii]|uniref:ZYRO0C04070p n=2 Tax=Zygosaccharomyces rouxii TaxID=4956 RepID=C5DSZ0_ZYGRC|nr:uncharacterized protein ZYRO0C04070g [Zygosaccharomyces rouxii]KAH9201910.1 PRELI-like family-domain-containing protein [Zygosaccharomyces rouxii]GAV47877.1 hypothetical protein ZYGR_0I01730 [Zygosaccharomyces rouxii]CAR26901.1 ZYRO0C04070p [Zygosaccharomyces rouxii]
MRLFQNSYDFNYPWEQVTAANWKKYPNEVSTHVIAVDVLRREVCRQGRQLVSERLITVKQGVPKWITMIVGASNLSYVREVSVVDLDSKTLTLRSCNLTYSNILKVFETVRYSPHPEDPQNKTLFNQEAQITAFVAINKLCNKLEEFSVQRFRDNASKGKQGFDSVLEVFSAQWDKMNGAVNDSHSAIINGNFDLIKNAFRNKN